MDTPVWFTTLVIASGIGLVGGVKLLEVLNLIRIADNVPMYLLWPLGIWSIASVIGYLSVWRPVVHGLELMQPWYNNSENDG